MINLLVLFNTKTIISIVIIFNCLSYSFWKDMKTEFLNDLIDGSIVSFRHVFLDYPTNYIKNPFQDLGSLEALTLFLDVNGD